MEIGPYISELLEEQDELSLPGIGTFYKKRQSAYYDEAEDSFFPPSQTIALKAGESFPSTELVTYVSKRKNLSPPSARYFTEKYAESVRAELSEKGSATIEGFGILKSTEEGLVFEPSKSYAGLHNFGLQPVKEIRVVEEIPSPEKESEAIAAETIAPSHQPPALEPVEVEIAESPKETLAETEPLRPVVPPAENLKGEFVEEERAPRRKVWPMVLAIGLLMILGFGAAVYLYDPELFNSYIQTTKQPQTKKTPVAAKKKLDDSAAKATADSIYDVIEQAGKQAGLDIEKARDTVSISTKATPAADTAAKAASLRYDVITASFNRKSEAEEYIRIMRKKGVDARIIEDTKRPKFKVSIGSFTDKEKAELEKRRIHEEITKEAWILKSKI